MAKLLVIYHSQTGNTEAMAKAVCEGGSSAGAAVALEKAKDASSNDLLACDAVAFCSPVYFGYTAGALKDFFDRVFYTVRGKIDDKPYAAFSSGGAGGKQALDSIDRVCNSFRLKKAFEGVVATGKPSSEVLEECKELGKKLAQF
jgi:multimeric flavodoxin WrbA